MVNEDTKKENVNKLREIIKDSKRGKIPKYSDIKNRNKYLKYIRQEYVNTISDTIVTQNLVDYLSILFKGKRCVEIHAGLGFLAKQLQNNGVDIIPIDDCKRFPKRSNYYTDIKKYNRILDGVRDNTDTDFVLYQYPGFKNDTARKMLRYFRRANPDVVIIIIGEKKNGLTADRSFFYAVEEITDNKTYNTVTANYYKWNNRIDTITFYKPLLSREEIVVNGKY